MIQTQKVKLEDVLEKLIDYRGKTPKKTTNGIPLITAKIIKNGVIQEPNEFIAASDYSNWMRRGIPQVGDVLLTTEAPLGEVAQINNPNIALAQRVITLRGKVGVLNNDYLKYFLISPQGQTCLKRRGTGTTVSGIKQSELRKIEINIPNYYIQTQIASIINIYDNLIMINEKRIKIFEEMAQRLYTEWFVKFKFPGHEKIKMVDSGTEYGIIPEGWEVHKIGDFLELAYGKSLVESKRQNGNISVYGSSGKVGFHNKKLVNGPGIVIGRKGNVGSVFWVEEDFYPIDTTYYAKTKLGFKFIYFLLKSLTFSKGDSAVPGLNRDYVYNIRVIVPDHVITAEFETSLESKFQLIYILRVQNEVLIKIRDLLIPQLVTGRRRLKNE